MFHYIFFILLSLGALWCAWQISVADFRRRIIPDVYSFPLMLIGLIFIAYFPWVCTLQESALGAVFGYTMSALIGFIFDYFLRKKNPDITSPIGMGDIKLMGIGGLWLGVTGLSAALVIACITGGIWAKVKKQRYIPFAPFFLIGGFLSLITMTFLL